MKTSFTWKTVPGFLMAALFAAPTAVLTLGSVAQAETYNNTYNNRGATSRHDQLMQNQQRSVTPSRQIQNRPQRPNDDVNQVLSPNLSCGSTERRNDVSKGALYGGGAGLLLLGGPIGALVGAGAGALTQQAQNNDACAR